MENNFDMIGGCMTAMITPFKNDEIDFCAIDKLIKEHIENNVGILVCGTTGETPTLSNEEYEKVIKYVVEKVDKKVCVMAGCGTNSTKTTIERAKFCESAGVDILLVITPYYNKTTQEGMYKHFEAVANAVKTNIFIYNVPGRTGLDMSEETVIRLSKISNIIGIKESSGSIIKAQKIVENTDENFLVYSGNDDLTIPMMSIGGKGVISVISNIYPKYIRQMVDSFNNMENKKAAKMQTHMLELNDIMFCETNPIPVKRALYEKGICENELRMPLLPMSQENSEKLIKIMNNFESGIKN